MAPSESASEKKAIPPQQWDSTSAVAEIEATAGSGEIVVDKEKARKVMRKLDIRIIPTIMWVYLMNMMDRGMIFGSIYKVRVIQADVFVC